MQDDQEKTKRRLSSRLQTKSLTALAFSARVQRDLSMKFRITFEVVGRATVCSAGFI